MIALCCVFIFPTSWIVWQCRPPPFFPILEFPPAHVSISAPTPESQFMTLTREGGEGRGERGGGKAGEQFKILILVPLHGGGEGGAARKFLQPFISTSYHVIQIFYILFADNICYRVPGYRSFQHPTNCFIFWIFYLPTIYQLFHILDILLADNICYPM